MRRLRQASTSLFLRAEPLVYGCSLVYRNPVYHQCVFASLMIATLLRETYLLTWSDVSRTIPDKKKVVIVETLRTEYSRSSLDFLSGILTISSVDPGPK